MQTNLGIKNIVLVGLFNVQQLDKYFFIKNEIVKDEDILKGSIFDSIGGVTQLVCENFNVLISAQQIIITDSKPENNDNGIADIISKILKSATDIKITALGINFHWFLSDEKISLEEFSRRLFYNDKVELFNKCFISKDYMFGAYASTNFKNSRLKLDVKPTITHNSLDNSVYNVIDFSFNFHFDNKNKFDNVEILNYLSEFDSYKSESEKIISIYK